MGRPRKGDVLVDEQFHVGLRMPPEFKGPFLSVLGHMNERRTRLGARAHTPSSLVREWIQERLATEVEKLQASREPSKYLAREDHPDPVDGSESISGRKKRKS